VSTMTREPLAARFAEVTQAANQGDFGPFMTLWAEDAVWIAGGENPFSGRHRGHDEVRRWFETMVGLGMQAEPLDVLEDDGHFVFFIRLRGQRGDKRLDQVHADAWTVRDGKFTGGFFLPEDQAAWDDFLRD
jgi:ketosteroid isomerase-like protein